MAIQIERLIATLEARMDQYEKGIKRAVSTTDTSFRKIETRGKQMESRLAKLGAGVTGKGLLGIFAAGASVRGAQQLIDTATRIDNSLKVAGLSGDELARVYDRLFASAQRNAAPLESLVTLYGRASLVQNELKVSTEELLGFTDNVALALRVAGTDAAAASGALLQLSQALGAGTVRAEEFSSIQEGALPVLQAVAAGLKEAGGSVAALRQLVVDGKVSSEAFFRAFEAGAPTLADKVAEAELTVSSRMVRLQNVLVDAAGKFNHATGVSALFGEQLDVLAGIVNGVADVFGKAADGPLGRFVGLMAKAIGFLDKYPGGGFIRDFVWSEDTLGKIRKAVGPSSKGETISSQIEALRREAERAGTGDGGFMGRSRGEIEAEIEAMVTKYMAAAYGEYRPAKDVLPTTKTKTVSLKDYELPPSPGSGSGGTKSKVSEYDREVEQITRRTAAMVAETEAQRQLNPLVEDYGYAMERARVEHELLAAAQEAGKEITPALRAEIAALADQYGLAAAEAEKLAEAHGKMADDLEFRKGLLKDALGGLRSALADGKLEFEELGDIALNVLDKIIGKIEDELVNAISKMGSAGGGGGGGGILSSLLGGLFGGGGFDIANALAISPAATASILSGGIGLFAKGTNSAPGGLAWVGEEGPELMNVPKGAQIFPSDVSRKIAAGAAGGGQVVNLAPVYNIDASNAQPGVGAEIEAALKRATKDMTPAVVRALRDIKRWGIRV